MQQSLQLIKQLMYELHGLQIVTIDNLFSNLSSIDIDIRKCLPHSDTLYSKIKEFLNTLEFGTIYSFHDTFSLSYVIFLTNYSEKEWCCIGPYRNYELTEREIETIREDNHLNFEQTDSIITLIRQVPTGIKNNLPIITAKTLLLSQHESLNIKIHDTSIKEKPRVPSDNMLTHIHIVERTYQHESMLMHYVSEGNLSGAMLEAEYFFNMPLENRSKDLIMAHRGILYTSNTLLRKTAQNIGIHPLFLDEISSKFARILPTCKTHEQLDNTFIAMVTEYCLMCRDHKNEHYSAPIQKIINYILSNISADLTPSSIAKFVNFSPSYTSRKFKEEVGMTLVNYITEQRIRIAKDLLLKQNMQVQDIAAYVGITDWNYFTKLFKKHTGTTPSNYRKSHRSNK